jgi:PAS domain S-box-containing protein
MKPGEALLGERNSSVQAAAVASPRAQVALWEWDLTKNQAHFSPEFLRQLGSGPTELINGLSEWESRLHPEDRERVMQGLRAYLTNPGACYEAEYRLPHEDNTYRWMLLRAEVIRDPQGRPCRILGYQLEISEQREAKEDQGRLAAIVESSEDAIIGKTLEGIVTSWNEGARRLFGYTAEEMLGQPVSRIIPIECSEEEAKILARLRRGERVEHYETVRRHKDGRLVNVFLTISPIRDGSGHIIGASKIARDITEQKKAEAATRQAHERLLEQAALLELAPVLVRDMESRIIHWSNGAERLYGFSKAEALGRVSHELFQTEFAEGKANVDEGLRRDYRWEGELVYRKRDGKQLVVASQQIVYCDSTGRPLHILEVNADITERKSAEQGLRESQARFAGIIDSAMDAIISIDEAQRVVLFNTAAERMFGCAAAEALGHPLERFIPARLRPAHRAHVEAFGATGVTSRTMGKLGDLTALRSDGEEFPIEASISQTEVSGAKLFTVILRDITERKTAEVALSRSEEQLRALTARLQQAREEEALRIARELHDQLGRCLTTIKMDVAGIERMLTGGVAEGSFQALIERATRMSKTLDETVLTVRRISAELRPAVLDDLGLAAAIDWQARDFQARSGVSCVVRLPENDLELSRDQATALFRIFQESLTNVARHAQATKLWVNLSEEEGAVVLEIEDNGVGISAERLAERRSLGLLGMRERVAVFGGEIEFAGAPGQGTAIVVRMPVLGANDEDLDR